MKYFTDQNPGEPDWNEYVTGSVCTSFSHLYGWTESISSVYGLQCIRLAVRDKSDNDSITGIMPLILFDWPNQPSRLISLPFTDAAGIAANDNDAFDTLMASAVQLMAEKNVDHLEIRQHLDNNSFDALAPLGRIYNKHSFKLSITKELPESAEELWDSLSAKVRNQVRKARRNNCRIACGGSELLDDFYAVFSENMRDLGSPVHSFELFEELLYRLSGSCTIITVYHEKRPAAAAMVFRLRDTLYNPWASSVRRYRPVSANMLLYWSMLEYGCRTGCTLFDFGRSSPNASTCRFKLQWDPVTRPLTWHVLSPEEQPWDPGSELLVYDWIKMLPLYKANRSGPPLRRRISL